MNYDRSATEYNEVVGAGIYQLLHAELEKLREANITANAMAMVLKSNHSQHGAGCGKISVAGSRSGIKITSDNLVPDIAVADLQVKWSDVAKLIKDDDFYAQYIHALPAEQLAAPQNAPALFDYGELPKTEADEFRKIEQVIKTETASYFTILGANFKAAQELLANHSGGAFERWYTAVGFKRQTVYRLIQRYEFMCSPKLGEQADAFEGLPLSLSCEISKPSAPPELVEQVLSGDITSHKEYQKLLSEYKEIEQRKQALDEQVIDLERQVRDLENRPVETAVETQEVIPEGYVSPEEHRAALDELEKQRKRLSDEVMRLKGSRNAEKTGRLVAQIEDLDKQLHDQQSETKKAWGKAARAEYDAETKGIALEEARQKNAELEKQIAELRSAEKPDTETAEKLFTLYRREAQAILTSFVLFANAPENCAYRRKAAEVLESYLKALQNNAVETQVSYE